MLLSGPFQEWREIVGGHACVHVSVNVHMPLNRADLTWMELADFQVYLLKQY